MNDVLIEVLSHEKTKINYLIDIIYNLKTFLLEGNQDLLLDYPNIV